LPVKLKELRSSSAQTLLQADTAMAIRFSQSLTAMNSYIPTLAVVALLTFLAEFGIPIVASQRDGFLPLANFEPFVYSLYIASGLALAVPSLARLPERFIDWFVLPFAAALAGWGLGLTLSVLATGQIRQALLGLFLTSLTAAFSYAPIFFVRRAKSIRDEVFGRMFGNRKGRVLVYGMSLVFLTCGFVGLWRKYCG
jgi:hypothetical protein